MRMGYLFAGIWGFCIASLLIGNEPEVQNHYITAHEKLLLVDQDHLMIHWTNLTLEQQNHLVKQVNDLDINVLHAQEELLQKKIVDLPKFTPFSDYGFALNPENRETGQALINNGEVGCLVVAGGQGTRLRIDGPKGMFPVTVIKKKSLFELLAHKIIAAGKLAEKQLSLAIMTSPANHKQTVDFFVDHNFFGLNPEQVDFFQQKMLPVLDNNGNLFLETPWTIAAGADGNGSALSEFVNLGIWDKWQKKGIKYVNFIQIDNALADPFDAELVGYHTLHNAEITIKCTERSHPKENVGLLVSVDGKPRVIEYSEMDPQEKASPLHRCANISLFCLSMGFIKKLENYQMPLHVAHKAVKYLNEQGSTAQATELNAWKFEKFIFDILPAADRIEALMYPREQCFAPLKNFSGNDSLATVQESLQNRDRKILAAITGNEIPNRPFELAQEFYYPTEDLLRKWLGKEIPDKDYIEP